MSMQHLPAHLRIIFFSCLFVKIKREESACSSLNTKDGYFMFQLLSLPMLLLFLAGAVSVWFASIQLSNTTDLISSRICSGLMPGLSNALCEIPPSPFFGECAVAGSARHGTLTIFIGWGGLRRGKLARIGKPWFICRGTRRTADLLCIISCDVCVTFSDNHILRGRPAYGKVSIKIPFHV